MASCEEIKLEIKDGDTLLSDLYVLKIYLSEGISMSPLAKLTVISSQPLSPANLKNLLDKNACVTLIQATGAAQSQRYVQGRITNVTFVQKVSGQVTDTATSEVSTGYSYVYEVSITSALEQLQVHVSCELLQGNKPSEVLEALLTSYYGKDQSFAVDTSALKDADTAFAATLGMYSQDNEAAYAVLQRLLCLAQANYCFVHKAKDFGEQLYVAAGLNFPQDSSNPANNVAQLYDDKGNALALSTEFSVEQKDSEIADFTYTCVKKHSPAFEFLGNDDSQEVALSLKDQQLLRADPFLQWLCPIQLDRNSKDSAYIALMRRLAQIKRNQLLLQGEEISAHAYNLAFQPNMRFTLTGLGEALKLVVLRSELLAVAPFPDNRAYPAPTHADKCLQLKLTLLNTDSFEKAGYGCLLEPQQLMSPELLFDFHALELFAQTRSSSAGAGAANGAPAGSQGSASSGGGSGGAAGNGSSAQQGMALNLEYALNGLNKLQGVATAKRYSENQPQLLTATVCTNTGTALDSISMNWKGRVFLVEQDNLAEPLQVYASLDDTQKLVVVELLNGLEFGGMVPRVGSKIKVLMSHGQYLCLGQVATACNVFDEEQRQRNLYSRRWSNKKDLRELNVNQSLLTCGSKTISTRGRTMPQFAKNVANPLMSVENNAQASALFLASSLGGLQIPVSSPEKDVEMPAQAESSLGLEYFDNAFDEVVFHLEHGSLDHLAFNQAVTLNNAALLSQYEQDKKALDQAYSDLCSKQNDYEAAHQAYFTALAAPSTAQADLNERKKEREEKSDAYVEAYNTFYDKVKSVVETLHLDNSSGKMQSNLYSRQGDVLLNSAQGNISLLAQGIDEAADSINLSGKTIKISADDKLVLAVGGNAISLDRNGVAIESRKWTGMPGMFDSLFVMDSMSGVSISGLSANISGVLGVNLSDSFGGSIGLANGSSNIGGMTCSIGASINQKSLSNLIRFFINGANEIVNMGLTLGKVDDATTYNSLQKGAYFATNDINSLWFNIEKGMGDCSQAHTQSQTNKCSAMTIVNCINDCLSAIVTLITATEHFMMSFLGATLNQMLSKSTPNYTVRDLIRTLASSLKVFMTLSTVIARMATQGLKKKVASISFSPEELKFDAKDINAVSVEKVVGNNPLAGAQMPAPSSGPQNNGGEDPSASQANTSGSGSQGPTNNQEATSTSSISPASSTSSTQPTTQASSQAATGLGTNPSPDVNPALGTPQTSGSFVEPMPSSVPEPMP